MQWHKTLNHLKQKCKIRIQLFVDIQDLNGIVKCNNSLPFAPC